MEKLLDVKLIESLLANSKEIAQIETKISELVVNFQQELEVKRQKDTELRESIKVAMRENEVKKFENDIISLTYVAPTTRTTIDTALLKTEKPELWKEYSKTTEVKDSVRITIK